MHDAVIRFYPAPATLSLKGLYLAHDLRARGTPEHPFVYTNFVSSIDGRISQTDPVTHRRGPPAAITHANDWHLYLELAAQADAVVTSGRRLRELCDQPLPELHCVHETAQGELADWRRARGMALHPVCIVLTASLDELPLEKLCARPRSEVVIMTATAPGTKSIQLLKSAGIDLICIGGAISGNDVVRLARQRGFRTLYAIGGPQIFNTLASANRLDRLYLSLALRLLGGNDFDTLLRGDWLHPPLDLRLHELYFDPSQGTKPSYLFASFDNAAPRRNA